MVLNTLNFQMRIFWNLNFCFQGYTVTSVVLLHYQQKSLKLQSRWSIVRVPALMEGLAQHFDVQDCNMLTAED